MVGLIMSRILRRPMFRGGRVESKGDLKVIDQMGIANLAKWWYGTETWLSRWKHLY